MHLRLVFATNRRRNVHSPLYLTVMSDTCRTVKCFLIPCLSQPRIRGSERRHCFPCRRKNMSYVRVFFHTS